MNFKSYVISLLIIIVLNTNPTFATFARNMRNDFWGNVGPLASGLWSWATSLSPEQIIGIFSVIVFFVWLFTGNKSARSL